MKVLVVYYSRSGVTRTVGQAIAGELKCSQEEIFDTVDRSGPKGWISAGRDASLNKSTVIKPLAHNPADFDLVVIGTPVWAFTMTPAIRTYLAEQKEKLNRVAFFCTQGGSGAERTFQQMEEVCGRKPVAVLPLMEKDVKADLFREKVRCFAETLVKNG